MPKTSSTQTFLVILTFTIGGIVDSKELKTKEAGGDFGSAYLLDHSAGSGPFVLDHWTKNTEFLLKANPNFGGTKPALSGVLFKHVQEPTNQQFALEKGDIDIANDLGPEQIAALQGKAGVTTISADSLLLVYVGMNAMFKPLDNVKVREALRTAVDYDGIVRTSSKAMARRCKASSRRVSPAIKNRLPSRLMYKAKSSSRRQGRPITLDSSSRPARRRRSRVERPCRQAEVRLGQARRDRKHQPTTTATCSRPTAPKRASS